MDSERERIFAPLKATLEARPMDASDLMELIGSFATGDSGTVAQAMAFHARDVMRETNDTTAYPTPIAAIYRRAFFDRECAAKYDITQILDQGPQMLRDFVSDLTSSLAMDARQLAASSLLDAPTHMQ